MSENGQNQTVIAAEVEITGGIKSSGSIRFDGKLDGELESASDVVIGKSAEVKGNLTVNSIAVEGTITGNIIAKDRIVLKSSAKLMGDIKSKRLAVEDGVTFIGKSEVNPGGAAVPADRGKAPAAEEAASPAKNRG